MFDLKISGGQLLDGLGNPPVAADIGVIGERIADVGDLSSAEAKETISAAGKCVCPGFIDAHSHSDTYLLLDPSVQSKIHQGVTTEIVGNCGASAAPRFGHAKMPSDWRDKKYPGKWSTVAEYRELIDRVKPAVNVRMLAGHNTLRASVIGYEGRAATRDELDLMKSAMAQAMDEGAAGLSTGLIYQPGMYAREDELVELASVAAARGGFYATHMRNEGARLIQAIGEALDIGRKSGAPVQISHLKTSGRTNWHLIDDALSLIEAARESGQAAAADRYPYTAGATDLDVVLPEWAGEGGCEKVMQRLRDASVRERIRREMLDSRPESDWAGVLVGSTVHPDNAEYRGKPVAYAAARLNMTPVDAILRLIELDELGTGAIFFGMSEENLWRILAQPWTMIGSDASFRALTGPLSGGFPHPRAYGAFPRFLRAALDGRTVGIADAVRKMTSLPASAFRLKDRGELAPRMFADIVVFDPETIRDAATYEQPHQLALGIETVIVNGAVSVRNGEQTNERRGRFLHS